MKPSFVNLSLSKTKSKPKFYLNNIFNFQSRIFNEEKRLLKLKKLIFINRYNPIDFFYLIPHVPCSYDCKESIKFARQILKILKVEMPEFAKEAVLALKRPFLFFDDFNWVAFDGYVKGDKIIYDRVAPYKSLYPQSKFKRGDELKVSNKEIFVSKEGELIHKIQKKGEQDGIVIDFS